MNPSSIQLAFAFGLITLGSFFAIHEKRNATALTSTTSNRRPQEAVRIRRRAKIASLLIFSGILFACSYWTDPRRNPVQFIIIWGMAFLMAAALLWHGIADLYDMRRQRSAVARRVAAEQLSRASQNEADPRFSDTLATVKQPADAASTEEEVG